MSGEGESEGEDGDALRSAGRCLDYLNSLQLGREMENIRNGIRRCKQEVGRSNLTGGKEESSRWGVGSTPFITESGEVSPSRYREEANGKITTPYQTGEFVSPYESQIMPREGYGTRIEGKLTEKGGSFVYVEVVDPQTGEVSYVPYLDISPEDIAYLMSSIEDQEIPRTYEEFVRFYFEQLAQITTKEKRSE